MRFAQQLPEYSQHCEGLSAEAERVRAVFRQAKSPGQMLFTELPRACGFDPEQLGLDEAAAETHEHAGTTAADTAARSAVEPFIARLIAVLRELNGAYPALLRNWQVRLRHALLQRPDTGDLADTRAALAARYQGLDRYAAQQGTAGAFIRRLTDTRHTDDQAWLESVMTLLAKVPPSKWRASHRINAELRLDDMAAQLADLEVLCQSLPDPQTTADTTATTAFCSSWYGPAERSSGSWFGSTRASASSPIPPPPSCRTRSRGWTRTPKRPCWPC